MKKRILLLFLMMMLMVSSIAPPVYAAGKFARANRTSRSDLIVVGDSRIYYIYKDYEIGQDTTYLAKSGGTYNRKATIINGFKKHWIKFMVKRTIKKHGSCRLVFAGTINEAANGYEDNTEALRVLAEEASEWTGMYKKKEISPRVFVTEALPWKNGNFREYIAPYNARLKAQARKYTYIELPNPKAGDYVDDIHFNEEFSKKLHETIVSETE